MEILTTEEAGEELSFREAISLAAGARSSGSNAALLEPAPFAQSDGPGTGRAAGLDPSAPESYPFTRTDGAGEAAP